MPWFEMAKTVRQCYVAHKYWKRAGLRTVLKKMVERPPSQALLFELEAPSGEGLRCLHPPQGRGAGG